MKEHRIRSAKQSDLSSVFELIVSQNQRDYGVEGITHQELAEKWGEQNFNLEITTRVAITESGRVDGFAQINQHSETQFSVSVFFAPEFSDLHSGYQLLLEIEHEVERKESQKVIEVSSRVGGSNHIGQKIFEKSGYTRDLSFITMGIQMTEPPLLEESIPGIRVQAFRQGIDEKQTYIVDEETAKDKGYHSPMAYDEWAERMGIGKEYYDPSLWFLAWAENEIVGIGLNFYWSKTNTGWIDHLGVKRGWRRKGIGRVLLLGALREFYQRDIKQVRLNVDSQSLTNAPKLYKAVGMETIQEYHFYAKEIVKGGI